MSVVGMLKIPAKLSAFQEQRPSTSQKGPLLPAVLPSVIAILLLRRKFKLGWEHLDRWEMFPACLTDTSILLCSTKNKLEKKIGHCINLEQVYKFYS